MAIQWKVDSNKDLPLAIIEDTEDGYGICELDLLHESKQANAALICDAVNNTAGKGIDPVAVPGMLRALQGIWQWNNNRVKGNTLPFPATLLDSTIKSAEIK